MGEVVDFKSRSGKGWFVGAMLLAAGGGAAVATLDMPKATNTAIELRKTILPVAGQGTVSPVLVRTPVQKGMARCVGAIRVTCVVDGDTFWWKGEKIRIENIDTPEMTGMCSGERIKAEKAAERLAQLLDGDIRLIRYGKDKYGRTLARVVIDGDDVGDRMVSEGLARAWPDGRKTWCDA